MASTNGLVASLVSSAVLGAVALQTASTEVALGVASVTFAGVLGATTLFPQILGGKKQAKSKKSTTTSASSKKDKKKDKKKAKKADAKPQAEPEPEPESEPEVETPVSPAPEPETATSKKKKKKAAKAAAKAAEESKTPATKPAAAPAPTPAPTPAPAPAAQQSGKGKKKAAKAEAKVETPAPKPEVKQPEPVLTAEELKKQKKKAKKAAKAAEKAAAAAAPAAATPAVVMSPTSPVEEEEGWTNVKRKERKKKEKVEVEEEEEASVDDGKLTIEVRVPQERMGAIVGPMGATRQAIEAATNTRISMPRKDDSSDLVTITGLAGDVAKAKRAVEDLATKRYCNITHPEWGTKELKLDDKTIGLLMADKATILNQIQNTLKTRIDMPKKGSGEKVEVHGPRDAVKTTRDILRSLNQEDYSCASQFGWVNAEVDFPSNLLMSLIGKSGEHIKGIMGNNKPVSIKISDTRGLETTTVSVLGPQDKVVKAEREIRNVIARAEPAPPAEGWNNDEEYDEDSAWD